MPTFAYTIRDESGTIRQGTSEGENESVIARRLQDQGYSVMKIEQRAAKAPAISGFGRVKLRDLSIFCRQFSTMIDAGISLIRCLSVLREQTSSHTLQAVIAEIEADVQAGQTLAKSMSKHPRAFNSLFLGLVHAGEVSGALEESLQRLSVFLEKDVELRRKVKGAMTYPAVVAFVAISIVILMCTFIVPKFLDLFVELGVTREEMPLTTQYLSSFSNFIVTRWWVMIAIIVAIVGAVKLFASTRVGRRVVDYAKLKAPIFGPLNQKICIARFARTLSTMLSSGVPILQSLETVAGAVSNEIISDAVLEARSRIREGDRIGDPLQKSRMFPPMVVQMISIGEESGALDSMLSKVADFYESEVDATVQSMTSIIEPVLIVFMGGAVGFIVISLYMPMVTVIENLQRVGQTD